MWRLSHSNHDLPSPITVFVALKTRLVSEHMRSPPVLVWFALVTFSFLFSRSFLLTIAFLFLVSIVFSALQPTAFCYHLSILLPSGYFLANNDSSRKTCSTTGIVWQRRLPTNLFSLETTSNCLYCACSAVLPMQEAIISQHPSRKLIYLTFWTFPEDRIHP